MARIQKERSLLEELGVPDPSLPDAAAPPVDRDVLGKLARKELPDTEARRVHGLVAAFKSWRRAYTGALMDVGGWNNSRPRENGTLEESQ